MSMSNLIECSDNYSKTSGCLWQYYRDEPFIVNEPFIEITNAKSFESKIKITENTLNNDNKKKWYWCLKYWCH